MSQTLPEFQDPSLSSRLQPTAPVRGDGVVRGGGSLWPYLALLRRRARLIVRVAVACAVLGAAFALLSTRHYVATAAFMPQEGNATLAGLGQLASQFGLASVKPSATSPQFYADLLHSREVMRSVLESQYRVTRPEQFEGTLIEYLKLDKKEPDVRMKRALDQLKKMTSVDFDRLTGRIAFEVESDSPELSQQVVNRYLAAISEFNLERRQATGRAERQFAEQRVAAAQRDLARAEAAITDFAVHNRAITSPTLLLERNRLEREVNLRQQVYMTLMQSYETARLEEVRNTPVITLLERPEGFVARKPRGTVAIILLSFMTGLLVTVGIVIVSEGMGNVRRLTELEDEAPRAVGAR